MKEEDTMLAKRSFKSPRLRVYGSVTELTKTQAPKSGSVSDSKIDGNESKKS